MFSFSRREPLLLLVVLATGACGNGTSDTSTTTPTTPTPTTVTETFSGQLNRNGAASYSFIAQASGAITATLNTLAPDSTLVIGLSLGTWNGTACQIVLANDKATQATAVTGLAQSAGNFCVRVYDVGNVVQPASYEIQVVHP